ncbi:phosphatidate cytidylyltransferase [Thalassobacter stenotrophicus]|uniref:phosphatidate cytidylyltransferase n=1 Tax=Thalassobacter stenotrophicus TaxID=266809 RepID=UPI0022A8FA04|nr:phosphatidate cytidylyltransferase [Thalassobacter stenotrophicus]UYP69226.1 phosphatidate cytidylyltransferase [Thalassobacter stenotrophicus]
MTNFADLMPRIATALVLVVIGGAAVWAAGPWFAALIAVVCGIMVWELARMIGADQKRALALGGLSTGALAAAYVLPLGLALPLLLAVPMAGIAALHIHRRIFMTFALAILFAGLGLTQHLTNFGLIWMLWLIGVVVASDIAGYFAGRLLGGPKFWPTVSPKKTWSGTVAGWVAAGLVGWAVMGVTTAGIDLIGISVALAMMAQMGDIAESAVKRKMGVKDSSNLLPGHGGLFDRFDAMLGAAVLLFVIESVAEFPPVPA